MSAWIAIFFTWFVSNILKQLKETVWTDEMVARTGHLRMQKNIEQSSSKKKHAFWFYKVRKSKWQGNNSKSLNLQFIFFCPVLHRELTKFLCQSLTLPNIFWRYKVEGNFYTWLSGIFEYFRCSDERSRAKYISNHSKLFHIRKKVHNYLWELWIFEGQLHMQLCR